MRHVRGILLHDKAQCHCTFIFLNIIKTLKWDLLSHTPYSPDLSPFAPSAGPWLKWAILDQFRRSAKLVG
ncbi:hypothetical protein CEXT_441961 [Caerostris extrusa]|uniref:Transposase n=1 Tax=Caerostris extrusa TaxID=172846 RepID=A0AAV4WJB8_CAEEX|nr:hypothetical protein CEXT_441961 [Caerostris extrusa]